MHSATAAECTAGRPNHTAVLCQNDAADPRQAAGDGEYPELPPENSAGDAEHSAGDPFPSATGSRTTAVRALLAAGGGEGGGIHDCVVPGGARYRPLPLLSGRGRSIAARHRDDISGSFTLAGPDSLEEGTMNSESCARGHLRSAARDNRGPPTTRAPALADHSYGSIRSHARSLSFSSILSCSDSGSALLLRSTLHPSLFALRSDDHLARRCRRASAHRQRRLSLLHGDDLPRARELHDARI